MKELWKKIPEYEQFEASSLGRIRNTKTNNILKPYINGRKRI